MLMVTMIPRHEHASDQRIGVDFKEHTAYNLQADKQHGMDRSFLCLQDRARYLLLRACMGKVGTRPSPIGERWRGRDDRAVFDGPGSTSRVFVQMEVIAGRRNGELCGTPQVP